MGKDATEAKRRKNFKKHKVTSRVKWHQDVISKIRIEKFPNRYNMILEIIYFKGEMQAEAKSEVHR